MLDLIMYKANKPQTGRWHVWDLTLPCEVIYCFKTERAMSAWSLSLV